MVQQRNPVRREPTRAQRRVLLAVHQLQENRGRPVSIREVMDLLEIRSTSTVYGHLLGLQAKGLVRPSGQKPRTRSRVLTDSGRQLVHDRDG